jgi:pyrimidine deaminase RibD-like protein
MSGDDHPRGDLAAFALGLGDEQSQPVRDHLARCAVCRAELAELRDAAFLTAALDPGDLAEHLGEPGRDTADGGPGGPLAGPGGDLLLARVLRDVRRERSVARRRSRSSLAAVAAVAVVVGAAGVVGLDLAPRPGAPAPGPSAPIALPSPGAGAVQLAGASASGATADVTVEPAAGWVRLAVRVTGIPAGERCRVVVVTADGERVSAGSWTVGEPPPSGTTRPPVLLAAAVPLDEVAAVEVETLAGDPVVSVPA